MAATPLHAPDTDLWHRLVALDLDGAAALSFSQRLARDNGWPLPFAQRVVLEYKKFLYLAATCGHPVTPSDEVDQAWHLHLVYTRSYWDELCGRVLGFALHHGPTQGGPAEGRKFQDWYAATRRSYEAAFGEAPPLDIWPPAAVRFGEAPHFRRVNMRGKWLLPKPRLPRWRWPRLTTTYRPGLALVALLTLAGCTANLPLNPFNWHGTAFLLLFWTLSITLLPLACWGRHRGRGPLEDSAADWPSSYALARLAQRGRLVADSALAALAYEGHISFPTPTLLRRTTHAPPANAYELSLWNRIAASGTPLVEIRSWGLSLNNPALRALDEELLAAGLQLPAAQRRRLDRVPLATAAALALLGIIKLLVGLSRDRPVGFLALSLVALAFATVAIVRYRAWATGRGAAVLHDIEGRLARQRGRADGPGVVIMAVAVLGVSSLHSLGLGQLADHLAPFGSSSGDGGSSWVGDGGSSGCSSGDGGGSGCGGGGCGGCGGCGS